MSSSSKLGAQWPAMALLLLANAVAFRETRRTNRVEGAAGKEGQKEGITNGRIHFICLPASPLASPLPYE